MKTNEETVVLTLLRRQAPHHSSGDGPSPVLSASQVLLVVDRLSREGTVVLRKSGLDYSVALGARYEQDESHQNRSCGRISGTRHA